MFPDFNDNLVHKTVTNHSQLVKLSTCGPYSTNFTLQIMLSVDIKSRGGIVLLYFLQTEKIHIRFEVRSHALYSLRQTC